MGRVIQDVVEFRFRLCEHEGKGISGGVLDDGVWGSVGPKDVAGESGEVLEGVGEGSFECGNHLGKESGWVGLWCGEGVEEDALHWVEAEPEQVEESEREGCLGRRRRRGHTVLLVDFDVVRSHWKQRNEYCFTANFCFLCWDGNSTSAFQHL
ncbi:hypothetical protein CR513_62629, partial [Mucuna pruriens]